MAKTQLAHPTAGKAESAAKLPSVNDNASSSLTPGARYRLLKDRVQSQLWSEPGEPELSHEDEAIVAAITGWNRAESWAVITEEEYVELVKRDFTEAFMCVWPSLLGGL